MLHLISSQTFSFFHNLIAVFNLFQILLLESSNRLGGWIQTSQFDDGTVFEHGPRNMRASGKSAVNSLKLVRTVGPDSISYSGLIQYCDIHISSFPF